MIPTIALMIAVYGSARLINDGCKRHPGSHTATAFTWFVVVLSVPFLWLLAIAVNNMGR